VAEARSSGGLGRRLAFSVLQARGRRL